MKSLNRWIYAVIGVIALLCAGMVYAWSVMSKPIGANNPDWTAAELSLTFTLVMAFFCIGVMFAGFMSKKISCKIYLIMSGVFMAIGFFVASLTGASPAMLYIGFGVICGLGSGFAYSAIMSTMSQWFPDKQGLISGIMLMGFGLSAFIVGKVYAFVTPTDGTDTWKFTFKIMGVILIVILVICGLIFAKPKAGYVPPTSAKKKAVREPASDITTGEMIRKPAFWMYYIWAILISAAGLVLVSQGSGIATQVGPMVSDGNIATVVGLISIMNGVGRVIFGMLFDKKGYKTTMILNMIVFIVAGLILVLAITTANFTLVTLGFIVGGFSYGGVTPTNSALISDFFGRTNYPTNFSLINTNLIIASFASTIAGKLFDNTGSYLAPIFMLILCVILGFVVFFFIRRPNAAKEK